MFSPKKKMVSHFSPSSSESTKQEIRPNFPGGCLFTPKRGNIRAALAFTVPWNWIGMETREEKSSLLSPFPNHTTESILLEAQCSMRFKWNWLGTTFPPPVICKTQTRDLSPRVEESLLQIIIQSSFSLPEKSWCPQELIPSHILMVNSSYPRKSHFYHRNSTGERERGMCLQSLDKLDAT